MTTRKKLYIPGRSKYIYFVIYLLIMFIGVNLCFFVMVRLYLRQFGRYLRPSANQTDHRKRCKNNVVTNICIYCLYSNKFILILSCLLYCEYELITLYLNYLIIITINFCFCLTRYYSFSKFLFYTEMFFFLINLLYHFLCVIISIKYIKHLNLKNYYYKLLILLSLISHFFLFINFYHLCTGVPFS